jgi:hypothetical protein
VNTNAFETAVYNKLAGASGLVTVLGGTAIYSRLAPQNADPPYVVFQVQSPSVPRWTMGGTAYENLLYTVRAVTEGPTLAQAGSIDHQINLALNDQSLTISGYTHMVCRRESGVDYTEIVDGKRLNHLGGIYRIQADPT